MAAERHTCSSIGPNHVANFCTADQVQFVYSSFRGADLAVDGVAAVRPDSLLQLTNFTGVDGMSSFVAPSKNGKDELLLVYDYMENGSLNKFLHCKDGKPILDWTQRYGVIRGVACGFLYLHEKWEKIVIHRDIKASNVLIDSEMNGRLGDFGLARLYDHGTDLHTTRVVGTMGYLAPELL